MAVNLLGILSVVFFYIVILFVGIWAGRKQKTASSDDELDNENFETEEVMLAGRNIGLFVGIFTMTATWVGGGYINGTAEVIHRDGIIWCQAPFGYAFSLAIGGLFFANKMREQGYVTMLDPFQDVLGPRMGGLLFLPALCGEIFWSAAILAALGATVSVIVDMNNETSIILSAFIAVMYTLFGGLYSVAYTDVIQLFCIFAGLWLCIPFSLNHTAVKSMSAEHNDWWGTLPPMLYGQYLDFGLLLMLGGLPWQVYFQRVLSTKTALKAQILSYVAAIGCIVMAVPPMIIGAVARVTAWNETAYRGTVPLPPDQESLVLPMVLQYLTPPAVSFFGLGAVSAAVMSSSDSSLLSASSMFARNIYKLMIRQNASEHEVVWVMRVGILVVGGVATVMALTVKSIYGLWYLSSDLVYVILFPQLVCVVHFKDYCNTYGSLAAYIVGVFLRAAGGEKIMGLPVLIKYPYYDEKEGQLFPFRTFAMLSSFATLLVVTRASQVAFLNGHIGPEWDLFHCVINIPEDEHHVAGEGDESEESKALKSGDELKTAGYQTGMNGGQINRGVDESVDQSVPHTPRTPKTPASGTDSYPPGAAGASGSGDNVRPLPTSARPRPPSMATSRSQSIAEARRASRKGSLYREGSIPVQINPLDAVRALKNLKKDIIEDLANPQRAKAHLNLEKPIYKTMQNEKSPSDPHPPGGGLPRGQSSVDGASSSGRGAGRGHTLVRHQSSITTSTVSHPTAGHLPHRSESVRSTSSRGSSSQQVPQSAPPHKSSSRTTSNTIEEATPPSSDGSGDGKPPPGGSHADTQL